MQDYDRLKTLLSEMGSVVIGYSGGVDSTFLAKAATDALGDQALCVLVESCLVPGEEIAEAVEQAVSLGLNLARIGVDVLSVENVAENPPERCYYCKRAIFGELVEIARERGAFYVLDGANAGDVSDFRPGTKATAELGVRSLLKELGFTKARIREVSRELGLPTWNKPAYACLASRVPYGTWLTPGLLKQVEAAEHVLRGMGFDQVRVRHHGDVARIELPPEDIARAASESMRVRINESLRSLGYFYVALDLSGYRTGSMNEPLTEPNGR